MMRRCKFCNCYIGMYHKSEFCSYECKNPKRPKCTGIFCPIGGIKECAICGNTGTHVNNLRITPGTVWFGADGKSHGVNICSYQCEVEWCNRHAYNDAKPFPYDKMGDFGKFDFKKWMKERELAVTK